MKKIETDILVLGSGIAGLSFAIKAASIAKIAVVTKAACSETNTRLAQGGIACVWDEQDNFEQHLQDTLIAGAGHCNKDAVKLIVSKAPEMIRELMKLGVHFSEDKDHRLELGREGGHSRNRIVHVNDRSGMAVENILIEQARKNPNISFYEFHFAIDLLKSNDYCTGAVVLDLKKGEQVVFVSKATILATGGAGQVYEQTTNPEIATGDGHAMAHNAGAKIADMEFMQFHPTALYHEKANGFLISEALRGFGAELVLPGGKRFMKVYHPGGSLAPRDVVSRAIFTEMKKNSLPCIFLDATFLPAEELIEKFPSIYENCLSLGIDITRDPIPVVPAAHYICGGVASDLNGQTNISGLYALGEVSCTGVHGANRLASNSLLEGLVFADQAYKHISTLIKNLNLEKTQPGFPESPVSHENADPKFISDLREKIRKEMWLHVGINRNNADLQSAFKVIDSISQTAVEMVKKYKLTRELLELRNLSVTAKLIVESALNRKESLGTHFIEEKKPELQKIS
ncbi:MAG: L-aspartate oxidase [Bacteroidia bacterium]